MKLLLDAGSGGKASSRLIHDLFERYFGNPILSRMDDAAYLDVHGPIAMSTDSYIVTPPVFPGGTIGTLAVHGTVNDIAMLGARPKYLSCGFILEEGLDLDLLETVVASMADAAKSAGVLIVTGDTKVVNKGACDTIFINTAGIGEIYADPAPSGHSAQPGDAVLLSGYMGDHGIAVMAARNDFSFSTDIKSDSAALHRLIERLITEVGEIHVLRDPTRGGVATTLNEIAEQSGMRIEINENALPVRESTKACSDMLGLDPLYLANEGKLLCFLPMDKAEQALSVMRSDPLGKDASVIGEVTDTSENGLVVLKTLLGGKRILKMLEGAPLPRIC